jgi:hypothetical protein
MAAATMAAALVAVIDPLLRQRVLLSETQGLPSL